MNNNFGYTLGRLHLILGEECLLAKRLYDGPISLQFGALVRTPPYNQLWGTTHLTINAKWRIDAHDRVIAGFYDAREVVSEVLPMLTGVRIVSAHIDYPSYDLLLKLSNGWTLSVFCDKAAMWLPEPEYVMPWQILQRGDP